MTTFRNQAEEEASKGDEEGEVPEIRGKIKEYSVTEDEIKQYYKWEDKGRHGPWIWKDERIGFRYSIGYLSEYCSLFSDCIYHEGPHLLVHIKH